MPLGDRLGERRSAGTPTNQLQDHHHQGKRQRHNPTPHRQNEQTYEYDEFRKQRRIWSAPPREDTTKEKPQSTQPRQRQQDNPPHESPEPDYYDEHSPRQQTPSPSPPSQTDEKEPRSPPLPRQLHPAARKLEVTIDQEPRPANPPTTTNYSPQFIATAPASEQFRKYLGTSQTTTITEIDGKLTFVKTLTNPTGIPKEWDKETAHLFLE